MSRRWLAWVAGAALLALARIAAAQPSAGDCDGRTSSSRRQALEGRPAEGLPDSAEVVLMMPTFTATEMAGISRVMGDYHIQAGQHRRPRARPRDRRVHVAEVPRVFRSHAPGPR